MKRNRRAPSPLLQLGFLLFYAGCAAGHLSLLSEAACSFLCGAGAGLLPHQDRAGSFTENQH